jgi:hypothetical protein
MQVDEEETDSDNDDLNIIWSKKFRTNDVPENNQKFSRIITFWSQESG